MEKLDQIIQPSVQFYSFPTQGQIPDFSFNNDLGSAPGPVLPASPTPVPGEQAVVTLSAPEVSWGLSAHPPRPGSLSREQVDGAPLNTPGFLSYRSDRRATK